MNSRIVRTLVSLAALAAASLPVASHANNNPALDRCVQLFVKEVVPAGHPVEIRRDDILATVKPISLTRSKVRLTAQGEKHSKIFGRGECVIDNNGSLISAYLYDSKTAFWGPSRPKLLARNVDARVAFVDDTKAF